jgi:hypothetical protein
MRDHYAAVAHGSAVGDIVLVVASISIIDRSIPLLVCSPSHTVTQQAAQ